MNIKHNNEIIKLTTFILRHKKVLNNNIIKLALKDFNNRDLEQLIINCQIVKIKKNNSVIIFYGKVNIVEVYSNKSKIKIDNTWYEI